MIKNFMDMLFVYPPSNLSFDKFKISSFNVNLGSAYIIAFLREKGYKADQFISNEPNNVKNIVKSILSKNPKIIGFTVYSSNYSLCQLIARRLKEKKPDIIIVFGGPTATVQSETVLKKNNCIDICVRGNGEEICLDLIKTLKKVDFKIEKAELNKINGIDYKIIDDFFRNPPDKISAEKRQVPGYLDKFPSPYLAGIIKKSDLGIITARGCNQNCSFCNCALLAKRVIATHSVERVAAELDYISKQLKPNVAIDIFDDAFTLFPDRAMEICNKIIEMKTNIKFNCATRCDLIDENLLDRMKEAGVTSLSFALESAVPRVLRAIGKVQSPYSKDDPEFEKEYGFLDDFKKYIKYAKEIGIDSINISLMIGLPLETLEEGKETISFIKSMSDYIDFYAHNILRVCHGTPLSFNSNKFGISIQTFENGINSRTIHNYDTREIPLAPKSTSEVANVKNKNYNINVLSLSSSNYKKNKGFFNKIVIQNNILNKEFIFWIQDNLAINGPLIQIYSDYESLIREYPKNEKIIYKYPIPTNYLFSYYRVYGEEGKETLIPYGTNMFPEQKDIHIDLINTGSMLFNSNLEYDPVNTICIDRERNDILELIKLLVKLSENKNSITDFFNTNFYPYFSSLCRWENGIPNCQSLDTLFINKNYDIKVCHNGEPIGKVGDSFSKIEYNLKKIKEEITKRRGCENCSENDTCAKCLFPAFISEKEYCDLKIECSIEEFAAMFRTLDLFKNL